MKKILFILLAALVAAPSLAQDEGEQIIIGVQKEKSNAFFIGPKVGVTFSQMTDPSGVDIYDKSGVGFSGGLAMKMRFGKATENSYGGTGYFGVGLELKYKQNNVKTLATDETGATNADLSVGFFEVPIFLQVYPFARTAGLNSLYIELGISIAGTVSRSPESLTVPTSNADEEITYYINTSSSKLKGSDFRPIVGLGYTIPGTGLDINGRYYIGVNKMADSFDSKFYSLEVSLSWMFTAFKF